MTPFTSSRSSLSSTSSTSSTTTRRRTTKKSSLVWSLVLSLTLLQSWVTVMPGTEAARPGEGFCGDCQTFANAMQPCGTFTEADMQIPGEYVMQAATAKCICTSVLQRILWTCAKCMANAGSQAKGVPPQKYQAQCMAWGTTVDQWRADYMGQVAPGTISPIKYGTTDPAPDPNPNPNPNPNPGPSPNPKPSGGTGGNNPTPSGGSKTPGDSDDNSGNNKDNSMSGDQATAETNSGLNTTAVAISGGIIGVALVAGIFAVVMMKRRRRRHTPLDLDSLPGQGGFIGLDDKWEKPSHPTSPGLPPAPVASAGPMVGRVPPAHHGGYDGGYMDSSTVVGGYDPQYDKYDHYRGGPGSSVGGYDDYGQHYPSQFGAEQQHYVGYHPNHGQDSHDYGYENGPGHNGPYHQGGEAGRNQYL